MINDHVIRERASGINYGGPKVMAAAENLITEFNYVDHSPDGPTKGKSYEICEISSG